MSQFEIPTFRRAFLTGLLALIASSIVLSVLLMPALWALVCLPSVAAPPREPHEEPP